MHWLVFRQVLAVEVLDRKFVKLHLICRVSLQLHRFLKLDVERIDNNHFLGTVVAADKLTQISLGVYKPTHNSKGSHNQEHQDIN